MKKVPKYVLKMLERRSRLASELLSACCAVDEYCEKIGVNIYDEDACLGTDVRIYCEADGGYSATLKAIEKTLNVEKG